MIKRRSDFSNKEMRLKILESSLIIFFSSIGVGALTSVLLSLPIALIIKQNSSLSNFISDMLGTIIALFIFSYKEGYRLKKFSLSKLLLAQLTVLIVQIVIVFIFGHAIYFSGPTLFLSRFIFNIYSPDDLSGKVVLETYRWLLMIITHIFLYTPIIIFGEYLGFKKYKKGKLQVELL